MQNNDIHRFPRYTGSFLLHEFSPWSSVKVSMEFCEGGRADDRSYMLEHDIPVEQVFYIPYLIYST